MRRQADPVRLEDGGQPFGWVWWLPVLLVGVGLGLGSAAASAFGMGLAAALSLSGSI
jgi:hypothetical protein